MTHDMIDSEIMVLKSLPIENETYEANSHTSNKVITAIKSGDIHIALRKLSTGSRRLYLCSAATKMRYGIPPRNVVAINTITTIASPEITCVAINMICTNGTMIGTASHDLKYVATCIGIAP